MSLKLVLEFNVVVGEGKFLQQGLQVVIVICLLEVGGQVKNKQEFVLKEDGFFKFLQVFWFFFGVFSMFYQIGIVQYVFYVQFGIEQEDFLYVMLFIDVFGQVQGRGVIFSGSDVFGGGQVQVDQVLVGIYFMEIVVFVGLLIG